MVMTEWEGVALNYDLTGIQYLMLSPWNQICWSKQLLDWHTVGSAVYRINIPAGYKQNFVPCAESQGFLTSAIVLRDLDYIDVCV